MQLSTQARKQLLLSPPLPRPAKKRTIAVSFFYFFVCGGRLLGRKQWGPGSWHDSVLVFTKFHQLAKYVHYSLPRRWFSSLVVVSSSGSCRRQHGDLNYSFLVKVVWHSLHVAGGRVDFLFLSVGASAFYKHTNWCSVAVLLHLRRFEEYML